ncbi:MAG TPA: hypothetical protein PKE55_02215 [Kiritimatiellia bacterium]|nr:hypothetical protein [Kiritimatiellia bacterium]
MSVLHGIPEVALTHSHHGWWSSRGPLWMGYGMTRLLWREGLATVPAAAEPSGHDIP